MGMLFEKHSHFESVLLFLHGKLIVLPAAGEIIAEGHQCSDPDGQGVAQEEAIEAKSKGDAQQQAQRDPCYHTVQQANGHGQGGKADAVDDRIKAGIEDGGGKANAGDPQIGGSQRQHRPWVIMEGMF